MDLGLRDAAVVVTGGTGGMGRAAAECFAEDGARVAVFGRTATRLEETATALRKLGSPDAVGLRVDVAKTAEVDAAFAEIARRWGKLNVLVNCVGPDQLGDVETLTDEDWMAAFDVGTLSAVRCVRAGLPLLRKAEWARIVNVSAHSTKRQAPTLIAYTASARTCRSGSPRTASS
jgi:NAD(P)-dependent dehydrogenase (short-subunit alcohol dehydrogenase family)